MYFFYFFHWQFLRLCFNYAPEHILVKIWCLKQKLFKTLLISRIQAMYWRAHKTATLTSIQHTVSAPVTPLSPGPPALASKYGPLGCCSWYGSSSARELILQWENCKINSTSSAIKWDTLSDFRKFYSNSQCKCLRNVFKNEI